MNPTTQPAGNECAMLARNQWISRAAMHAWCEREQYRAEEAMEVRYLDLTNPIPPGTPCGDAKPGETECDKSYCGCHPIPEKGAPFPSTFLGLPVRIIDAERTEAPPTNAGT